MTTRSSIRALITLALFVATLLPAAPPAEAGRRVKVVRRPARTRVVVHRSFPIRRTLPRVVVRGPRVRVAPRVFLGPVVFGAVVVTTRPAANVVVWHADEVLVRDDEWIDFSLDADRRGTRLLLDIDKGPARISFAEVVFDNGEAQVVDFNERRYGTGLYALLDFKDGRKIDHVRIVARADGPTTSIGVHLVG